MIEIPPPKRMSKKLPDPLGTTRVRQGTARILSIVSTVDNQFVVTLDQPVTIGPVAQDDPGILIGGTTPNAVTQVGPDSFMIHIIVLGGTGYWWAVTGQPGYLVSPMLIVPQVGMTS